MQTFRLARNHFWHFWSLYPSYKARYIMSVTSRSTCRIDYRLIYDLLARENLKWKSQDSSLLVKGHYCTDVIFDWTTIYWDLEVSYVEDAKCENFCSLAPLARYNLWNFLKFMVFWSRSYECCKHEDINIVPRKYVFENKILRSWRIVCLRRKN